MRDIIEGLFNDIWGLEEDVIEALFNGENKLKLVAIEALYFGYSSGCPQAPKRQIEGPI